MQTSAKDQSRNRVVAYLRVSTDKQADRGISLEAQEAKARAYCQLYDLELVAVQVDAGISAKTLNRPGLRAALGMLEAGTADCLLVCKLDRLTRSVRDLGDLVDRWFAAGRFALLSIAETVDTRTAAGRLVLNVLASVAQWEREATGERTRDALAHLKAEGVQLGGEALGWTRTGDLDAAGRRICQEVREEVDTVARILELRAAGLTLRAIAAALEAEGRQTKAGGAWHPTTINRVLTREAA